MSLDAAALRESFALVVERSPNITHRFYEIFFAKYPQVQPMFGRRSQKEQEQMLTQALVAVIDHVEDGPFLQKTLHDLGYKHVSYGVEDHMYGWVGECLLTALGEALGDDFTPRVRTAWETAYKAIVTLTLEGANAARKSSATSPSLSPPA